MPSRFTRINDSDDVIIALEDLKKGDVVDSITLLEDVKQGHKIATHDMAKGHRVIKYGCVIGELKEDVKKGCWIHSHNLKTHLDERPTYSYSKHIPNNEEGSKKTFLGYVRKDGRVGIRNDIYIVPLVGCVNGVISLIKKRFVSSHKDMERRVKLITHPYGCSQLGDDMEVTRKILAGLATNPNAGATLLVGLGCENNRLSEFLTYLPPHDEKRLRYFNAQDYEDDVAHGVEVMEELYDIIKDDKRVECGLDKLVLGLKCGGSDGFSGLTANPLVGMVSEVVGQSNGKVGLTEVPEMFGAEQQLMNRAKDETVFSKIVALINNFKDYYARNNQPCYENPSPGNKDGGITTLEEKSLGCVLKGGHLQVNDVLDFGERFVENGLSLVNGPGNDIVASTNLAASGATLLIFTTGRGTPFGSVIPTIKVATNHKMAKRKADWIDFDAEIALDTSFKEAKDKLLDLVLEVCSGKETKAELNEETLVAIFKQGVTL